MGVNYHLSKRRPKLKVVNTCAGNLHENEISWNEDKREAAELTICDKSCNAACNLGLDVKWLLELVN